MPVQFRGAFAQLAPSGGRRFAWHTLVSNVRLALPWLVFVVTLVVLLVLALALDSSSQHRERLEFRAQATNSAEHLQDRLRTYEQLLYAMRGLFDVQGAVTGEQFHRFAHALLAEDRFSEVLELSFMAWPGPDTSATSSAPSSRGASAFAEEFVEPRSDVLTSAIPDPQAEPNRQASLERAMLSGVVASSSFVPLSESTRVGSGRGIIVMRLAVYRGGGIPATASAHQSAILGLVAITVRLDQLARSTLMSSALNQTRVQIFEAPVSSAAGRKIRGELLFDSGPMADKPSEDPVSADYTVTRPLLMPDRTWLCVFSPLFDAGPAHNDALRMGFTLAASLVLAFVAAWLTHTTLELSEQRTELIRSSTSARLMLSVGEDLDVCRGIAEAHSVLSQQLPRLLPGTGGVLYRYDAAAEELLDAVLWGEPKVTHGNHQPSDCQAVRRGQVFEGFRSGFRCMHVAPEYAGAYMCVPLSVQGELGGVLHVQLPDPFEKDGIDLKMQARSVAQQASLALANLQLRERLQEAADRDRLTGLYSRRFASGWLDHELIRCQRASCGMAAVMLDIDHFKAVNDGFGHDAGDRVLQEFGQLLRAYTRGGDAACRYGGEEFLLLLPMVSERAAYERADQIRKAFEELRLDHAGRDVGKVTVSAGIAVFPTDGSDAQSLIQAADNALYAAKAAGRNRVVCFSKIAAPSTSPMADANEKEVLNEPNDSHA